jgi:2-polyprenyl-3-methyl-5-hydroxy-6-metoxy-1,4-benzoquinol methylase
MVAEDPGHEILEVGSGGGHVLRMFRRAHLTAVDVSTDFLETAKQNLAGYDVKFLLGELAALKLPAASYDRIICTEVLEHTAEPELILAEISRLLRASGRAVITVPNDPLVDQMKGLIRKTPVRLLGWRVNWGGDEFHIHKWRPAEFRAVLERHFVVEEQRAAPFDLLPIRACFLCRKKA